MATKTIIEGKTPSRDEAAALAMAGILAAGGHRDKNGSYDFESMAVSAYYAADALAEHREREGAVSR